MLAKLVWRQSTVAALLRCPRRVYLEHVLQVQQDYQQSGYANWRGTAGHAVIELGLAKRKATGQLPTDEELAARALEAFEEAVLESEERGVDANPDGIAAAMDALVAEDVPRYRRLLEDPRLEAIHWRGLEVSIRFTSKGREWSGTIDAVGVALRTIPDFGVYRGEPVALYEGEEVVVDWKTGSATELGWLALDLGVQLGIYGWMLQKFDPTPRRRRYFIAHVQDVEPYVQPPGIPKNLPQEPNPAWLKAVGLPLDATAEQAKKVRRRPKGEDGEPIEKWLPERVNPAWEAARSQPRGPVFYEARPVWPTVAQSVGDAIRMAEAGIWPASGALTGQCPRCPYARHCASASPTTQRTENDQ